MNQFQRQRVPVVILAGFVSACSSQPAPPPADPDAAALQIVRAATQPKPEDEVTRQLLLVSVDIARGKKDGVQAVLDELEKKILALPPADEQKTINFGRLIPFGSWIDTMLKLDPARALAAVKRYGDDSNLTYQSRLVQSLAGRTDCTQPAIREGLKNGVALLFEGAAKHLEVKSRYAAIIAPNVVATAAIVSIRCGDAEMAKDAVKLMEKVRRLPDAEYMQCQIGEARALATYTQDATKALAELGKLRDSSRQKSCVSEQISVISDATAAGPPRPDAASMAEASRAAIAGLLGEKLSDRCSATALPKELIKLAPEAVDELGGKLFESWKKEWSADAEKYCQTLPRLAELGKRLTTAGRKPAWLCGLVGARPAATLDAEQSKAFDAQRIVVAAHLSAACPSETAPVIDAFATGGSLDEIYSVIYALAEVDKAKARAVGERLLARAPEPKKYDVARTLVIGLATGQ